MTTATAATSTSSDARPGGRTSELFNDHLFEELRARAEVPLDFVNEGWTFGDLRPAGGKGGRMMVVVGDYIVKELSLGDHKTLLGITPSYAEHALSGETLLCPIFLHWRDVESRRYFFAMSNNTNQGPYEAVYDLKGCADDKTIEIGGVQIKAVHKRIWNIPLWISKMFWSEDRLKYYRGKLSARRLTVSLPCSSYARFVQTVDRDTKWLEQNNLMDYSLLVAVKDGATHISPALGERLFPYRHGSRRMAVQMAIIDFFQTWTVGKQIASVIKSLEDEKATVPPAVYAKRFRELCDRLAAEATALTQIDEEYQTYHSSEEACESQTFESCDTDLDVRRDAAIQSLVDRADFRRSL